MRESLKQLGIFLLLLGLLHGSDLWLLGNHHWQVFIALRLGLVALACGMALKIFTLPLAVGRHSDCSSSGRLAPYPQPPRDAREPARAQALPTCDMYRDALTGLPNREAFTQFLEQALCRGHHKSDYTFAVLYVDVDRFKLINDSLGRQVGDQLLQAFADRLTQFVRPGDSTGRLNGDEFVILLHRITDLPDVIKVAERLHETLKAPFQIDHHEIFVTASIGITSNLMGATQAEDLLRQADLAMYQAKQEGRARHAVFDPTMHTQILTRLALETGLQNAIKRQEVQLYYQPILSTDTQTVVGFEALARWRHPEWGLISPGEFIPIAEETGLIGAVGDWVRWEACRQLRLWKRQYAHAAHLTMSVNVSVKQFGLANVCDRIESTLLLNQLSNRDLKLEITESLLIENPEAAAKILRILRSKGIQICIDDFGTGYASLSYLHHFPLDTLKIDRSFTARLQTKTPETRSIVQAITQLAHTLNLDVVAEGVETSAQLDYLQDIGCDFAQGYLFGQPLDSRATEAWLVRHWLNRVQAFPRRQRPQEYPAGSVPRGAPSLVTDLTKLHQRIQ